MLLKKVIVFLLMSSFILSAADVLSVRKNLEKMPRPWKNKNYNPADGEESYPHTDRSRFAPYFSIGWQVYEASVRHFAEKYPHVKLEIAGRTLENDPLFALTVTDFSVHEDEKFKVLIYSIHGGQEKNGIHACLAALDFLSSPACAEYRKKFEFRIIPTLNPYGAFRHQSSRNSKGIPLKEGNAWDVKTLTLKDPASVPELVVFKKIVDEMKPELILDCHGFGVEFKGQIMTQCVMGSCGNHALRAWSQSLINAMHKAANADGGTVFPYEEEELQRLPSAGEQRRLHQRYFRHSWDNFETSIYSYLKYHTLVILPEVAYDELAVECLKGLFDFTDDLHPRFHRGLPVDNIFTAWGGKMVQSYGNKPGERRRSRVDLWSKVPAIHIYNSVPQSSYHVTYAAVFGKKGFADLFGKAAPAVTLRLNTGDVFKDRPDTENFRWSAIREFIKPGVRKLYANGNLIDARFNNPIDIAPPQHGVTLASDIPIAKKHKVTMLDVRLNGFPLKESAVDGYELVKHDAGHRLFINVPPEKARKLNLFIVTYAYDSDADIKWTWQPNKEILEKAKTIPRLK